MRQKVARAKPRRKELVTAELRSVGLCLRIIRRASERARHDDAAMCGCAPRCVVFASTRSFGSRRGTLFASSLAFLARLIKGRGRRSFPQRPGTRDERIRIDAVCNESVAPLTIHPSSNPNLKPADSQPRATGA